MVDIEELKHEIVERLKPLNPDKIILFGSYAYGTPTEDSDIDLFLVKDSINGETVRDYTLQAKKQIRDLVFKHKIGFDVLSAPSEYINNRDDYFYKVDILEKGKVLYGE